MKKILIINLRRLGDVFSTAHLVNSLSTNSNIQLSLLTYEETSKAAKAIKNVANHFHINRKEIISLKSNKLFSDGFALEQLYKQINPIRNQEWDLIINYSNDTVGAYLCSYLKPSTKKVIGVHYSPERNIITQGDWELLFNNVLPIVKYAPVHFVDCYHKMCGLSVIRDGEKIKTKPNYNESAFNQINQIRRAVNEGQTDNTRVIGIQLKTADQNKDIPEEVLHEYLRLVEKNSDLIPLLLIAPDENERRVATEFNREHNNELIIVEADLNAIASVLSNIDLLVTPDTAIKHIADLTDTPVLEISLGHAPFLKQGTYSGDSLILTDLISKREFSKSEQVSYTSTRISAQDIYVTTLYSLSKNKNIKPLLSDSVTLYQGTFDQMGIRYTPIAGTVDTIIEIHRLMSRQLISTMFNQETNASLYQDICKMDIGLASTWIASEKTVVTEVMKDLLGTLRALLQTTENSKAPKDFIINLGKLISHVDNDSLAQIPISLFKTKLESINSKSQEENLKEVEVLLYELKNDIQKILLCLKELEAQIGSNKMEDMIKRNLESIKS